MGKKAGKTADKGKARVVQRPTDLQLLGVEEGPQYERRREVRDL